MLFFLLESTLLRLWYKIIGIKLEEEKKNGYCHRSSIFLTENLGRNGRMEMKKYKLENLCTKITDGSHYSPVAVESGYPMFSVKDMEEFGFSYTDVKLISEDDFQKMCENDCVPQKNDVLVAKDGSYLKEAFVCMETKKEAILSSIAIFRPNIKLVNPYYLAYLFKTPNVYNYVTNGCVSGTALPRIVLKAFKQIEVFIPSLKQQNNVVSVLSSLDNKIALNKRINARLEALAKRLYDYWFVQFDYPDKNGKPYKTSGGKMVWNEVLKREIPVGWEVKRLEELFITNRGVSYSTKTITGDVGIPMINLASFSPDGSYKIDGIKLYTGDYSQEKVLKPFDLVMCNTQQTAIDFSKDIIGKALLIPDIFEGDITSSHHVNTLKVHDEKLKFYLYRLFNTDYFHAYISHFASGTNILGLDFAGVENYTAVIPSDEILSKFADFTLNIEKKKSEIIRENKKLTDLRDRLLPLLMNGQVSVGTNNSSEFCNAKLGKQATACDMNGQVEVEG